MPIKESVLRLAFKMFVRLSDTPWPRSEWRIWRGLLIRLGVASSAFVTSPSSGNAGDLSEITGFDLATLVGKVLLFQPGDGELEEDAEELLAVLSNTRVLIAIIYIDSHPYAKAFCEMGVIRWLARLVRRSLNHSAVSPFVPGSLKVRQDRPDQLMDTPWERQAITLLVGIMNDAFAHGTFDVVVQFVETKFLFMVEELAIVVGKLYLQGNTIPYWGFLRRFSTANNMSIMSL